jgi:hypothetical protein
MEGTSRRVANEGYPSARIVLGDKASRDVVDPRAIARSAIEGMPLPNPKSGPVPSYDTSILMFLQQYADDMVPWGPQYKMRDQQLRQFILKENIFASALGIICSRNSGFSWRLDGPKRLVQVYQDILENADQGEGWHSLIVKTTIDLSTQDNGAFWEIVRLGDTPDSPVVGINHLDAARCWHTGNKEAPVIYIDRLGKYHLFRWWEVICLAEMPTAVEGLYGVQYCALSRMLRKAQTVMNDDILDYENSSGQNTKQVHLLKGVTAPQLTDAMNTARANSQNMGYRRFMAPVVVGTIDPTADVGHDTIQLATKASADPETTFVQYINLIAMAFESDYQEFAPLPGQKLGTGAQSETLHLKARGKGPGTFMKLIVHAMNFRILPSALTFMFDEMDLEAERAEAEVKAIRAQNRATRVASGEITTEVARQIAADEGDLDPEYVKLMQEQDVTPNVTVDGDASAESQTNVSNVKPGMPGPSAPPAPGGGAVGSAGGGSSASGPSGRPHRIPQPGTIKPVRAPTPLGTKSVEEEEQDWFDDYQEKVKAKFDDLLGQLDEATKFKGVRRIPVRDKQGIILHVDEVPLEI